MKKKMSPIALTTFFLFSFLLITHYSSFAEISRFSKFVYPEYSKKISMDFKDADLRNVLKIFSQQSGMNFIAATDIASMKVTLFFENVPVEEALERILNANGLIYEVEPGSDIFTVKKVTKPTVEVITRVYTLKNATVSTSKLLTTLGSESSNSASTKTESTSTIGDSNTGGGMIAVLESVLTPDNGKVIEDPRTNSLIVTDIPSQFPIIEKTIAQLDAPTPQILIQVEMLDISKTTADQLGVQYGTALSFSGAKRSVLYPWDQNKILSKGFELDPEYTAGTIDASGLTVMLQFLKNQVDTKNLANPKILTLNNQSAEIKISSNEAIGTVSTTTGGGSGVTDSTVEAERIETGIFLTVTPQINIETGEITMAIVPKVIEARIGSIKDPRSGENYKDPEERSSKTILRVKDNETIFLGGLKKNTNANTVTKVPLLGDIPLIGGAFRYTVKAHQERELVIFITPKIIDDQNNITPKTLTASMTTREQSISEAKRKEINKALFLTEQQRINK